MASGSDVEVVDPFFEDKDNFKPLTETAFYINAFISLFGLIYTLCFTIHAITKYSTTCGICKKKDEEKAMHNTMNKKTFFGLLSVVLGALVIFIVYSMEFFGFRMFRILNLNVSPISFCRYFQPFLPVTIAIFLWSLFLYFSVRLETSFAGSSLQFSSKLFNMLRIGILMLITMSVVLVFIFTHGVPWNVEDATTETMKPDLCRNVVEWEWYWGIAYSVGLFLLLFANIMNWLCYMNRLSQLVAMRLRYTLSFKSIVDDDISRQQQKIKKFRISTVDTTMFDSDDDEDYIDPSTLNKQSIPIGDQSPYTPATPQRDSNGDFRTAFSSVSGVSKTDGMYSQSTVNNNYQTAKSRSTTFTSDHPPAKLSSISKHDIKNRMIARRKPAELKLYKLIRKQSVLTGVVCISSVSFWVLQFLFDKGSIFILSDIIVNVTCVYLSVKWTKGCYNILCYQCSKFCCFCIEDYVESKVSRELKREQKRKKLEKQVELQTV